MPKGVHLERVLPIRAPERVHARLKQAAAALTKRNQDEGRLGKVTAGEVGLAAVTTYLQRLEADGVIPADEDEGAE